jgi:hypothetical protein
LHGLVADSFGSLLKHHLLREDFLLPTRGWPHPPSLSILLSYFDFHSGTCHSLIISHLFVYLFVTCLFTYNISSMEAEKSIPDTDTSIYKSGWHIHIYSIIIY